MKNYLIQTTTGDKWEFCGGVYIVSAKGKIQAKKLADSIVSRTSEKVTSITVLESKKQKILFQQSAQIE